MAFNISTDFERPLSLYLNRGNIEALPWRCLTWKEAWHRLLKRNKLIKQLFPKQAFLEML